jgi:hypothetical protein
MEETQQQSGAERIADPDLERASPPLADAGFSDLALDPGLEPRRDLGERRYPGTVLIAQREVEQQVLDREDPEPFEPLGDLGSDPSEGTDREAL